MDATHDTAALVNIVNRYPGLLELLPPDDGRQDYTKRDFWKQLCEGSDKIWPLPQADDLQKLGKVWKIIRDSPIDTERMIYIAGWAKETVWKYANQNANPGDRGWFTEDRPPVRFYSTPEGDGTVPWAFGRLPGVKTWYVEAAHDQLLAHTPAFPAYLDILQTGKTSRLSQDEPAISRKLAAIGQDKVMSDTLPERMPAEADLSGFVFGAAQPSKQGKQKRFAKVNVSVVHGNLAYARYPICVGHYYGDTIIGSEAELDKRLHGALSNRISLGLYPGKLNSHEVFLRHDQNVKPQGAIVVGLGHVGGLSSGNLAAGISQALLDYALKICDWPDDRFGAKGTTLSARISFILIGTGLGGIGVGNSVEAILNGVKLANERLVDTKFNEKVIIDEIEFLELYQDVAISAARELQTILRDGALEAYFKWDKPIIKTGPGGLRRVLLESDQNWWHRLEIIFDAKNQLLRFISLTDRARAEETLVYGQMRLADQFISGMVASTSHFGQPAQTLFEMLIPNRLKELAPDNFNVVLILDEESARFPWELLQDRWNASHKPQSVAAGMVRQLKTQEFRERPLHTSEKNAFVIGNPLIPADAGNVVFPTLPGAVDEALTVVRALANSGYAVNDVLGRRSIDLDAQEIMAGLHGAAYRILHLAGHGVHEIDIGAYFPDRKNCTYCGGDLPQDKQRVSGMVIGNNSFLTPGDVRQMRWVPDLVFINCCYLGNTEVRYPEAKRYNELAANLGVEFIRMGVKVVIAAGWAVNDGAAKAFAEKFYQALLSGRPFGLSVLQAREYVYEHFPDMNTWGAYQCYGDPDFRLFPDGAPDKIQQPTYHSKIEWLTELENIISTLHNDKHFDGGDQFGQQLLEASKQRVPEEHLDKWQAEADIAAALGTLYGELGRYGQAIEHLEKALAANKAEFSVKALEQLANYRVKHALQFRESADAEKVKDEQILKAINDLEVLNNFACTPERLSLLGSAYKRLAWFESDAGKRKEALKKMSANYEQAFNIGLENKKIDAYPLTNWMTAEAILDWFGKNPNLSSWKDKVSEWKNQAISKAKERTITDPEYWDFAVEPDCLLMSAVVDGDVKAEQLQRIVEGYRTAAQHDASQKDKATLREHIEFLIHMANQTGKIEFGGKLEALLRQLG